MMCVFRVIETGLVDKISDCMLRIIIFHALRQSMVGFIPGGFRFCTGISPVVPEDTGYTSGYTPGFPGRRSRDGRG
jgi:hypothetical protein